MLTKQQKAGFKRAVARNDGAAIDRLIDLWCAETAIPKPTKKKRGRRVKNL